MIELKGYDMIFFRVNKIGNKSLIFVCFQCNDKKKS